MCGQLKRPVDVNTAVDYAIAYAKDWRGENVRANAVYYLTSYAPEKLVAPAIEILARRDDAELVTDLEPSDIWT